MTYFIGKSKLKYKTFLAPLPAVVLNALVIGIELHILVDAPLALGMLQVGWGQFVCAYVLGLLLMKYIEGKKSLKKLLSEN